MTRLPDPEVAGHGPSVLVVDDDPDLQRWVAAVLEPNGCQVACAADTPTGLMMVHSVKPDVIVLDVNLPGGGGKVFLERLRKLAGFQHTPVLILSAEISTKVAISLQPFEVAAMLEKPANARLFIQAVLQAARSP
ncbi:MAG TPA: response regulator [Gemmatimonadales bacterium]|nr:response regulator [Gemmatimonadales bacterium]